jgi:hypothetical protein
VELRVEYMWQMAEAWCAFSQLCGEGEVGVHGVRRPAVPQHCCAAGGRDQVQSRLAQPRLRAVLSANVGSGRNHQQNPGEQHLLQLQLQHPSAPSYKDVLVGWGAFCHKGTLSLSSCVEGNAAAQNPEFS